MNKNWYAVYTKPQCEKKVVAQLSKKRIEAIAPLNNRFSGTGNKRKLIADYLFPSFVFLNITEADFTSVRQMSDVINFVYWLGKPAVVKTAEIENIHFFTSKYHNITLTKIPVNTNALVRITKVPMLEINRNVVSSAVNTIKVTLPSLGYMLQAETNVAAVESYSFQTEKNNLFI